MDELVFHNWVKVLVYLYRRQDDMRAMTLWRIGKELDISSGASIASIITLFIKHGVLKVERKGRNNKYNLTPKGVRIAEQLQKIMGELS